MQIIGASCIFLCDKEFVILKNAGLLFDSKIRAIGDYETLRQTHLDAEAHFYEGGVILPTFANPHIHFEFSANETSFAYGGFDRWLDSVMAKRDDVLAHSTQAIKEGISEQIRSGVGMVGAISSYGDDLELLAQSQLKVVYFNEAIGSNPSAIDFLYSHILKRIDDSMQYKSPRFRPGLAIHSPYSVHYVLAKKLLKLARDSNLPTSVHFLESEFKARVAKKPIGYKMYLVLANPNDPTNDTTALWSGKHQEIFVGDLSVDSYDGLSCNGDVFFPNDLPSGINPPKDPIFELRNETYGITFGRRQ